MMPCARNAASRLLKNAARSLIFSLSVALPIVVSLPLSAGHFLHDTIKRIAAFIRANFPSGFLEPLGLPRSRCCPFCPEALLGKSVRFYARSFIDSVTAGDLEVHCPRLRVTAATSSDHSCLAVSCSKLRKRRHGGEPNSVAWRIE